MFCVAFSSDLVVFLFRRFVCICLQVVCGGLAVSFYGVLACCRSVFGSPHSVRLVDLLCCAFGSRLQFLCSVFGSCLQGFVCSLCSAHGICLQWFW